MEFAQLYHHQWYMLVCVALCTACASGTDLQSCSVGPTNINIGDGIFEVHYFEAEEGILQATRKLIGTVILTGNSSSIYSFDEPYFKKPGNFKTVSRPKHFDIVFVDIDLDNASTTTAPESPSTFTTTYPTGNSTHPLSHLQKLYHDATGSGNGQGSEFTTSYTSSPFRETSPPLQNVTSSTAYPVTTDEIVLQCVKAYIYQVYDLDREEQDKHYLTIDSAEDIYLSIPTILIINVSDINDNSPKFVESSLSTTITNKTATGVIVAHIQAEDADIGQNADLRYEILPFTERRGNETESPLLPSVLIHKTTGIVVLATSVDDLPTPSKLTFSVVVKDRGDSHVCNRATATATISIVDTIPSTFIVPTTQPTTIADNGTTDTVTISIVDIISSTSVDPSSQSPATTTAGITGIVVGCSIAGGVLLIAFAVFLIFRCRRKSVTQRRGGLQFMMDDETLIST